jgi:hypothetical protein
MSYDSYYDFHIGKTYLIHLALLLNEKDIPFPKGNSYHRTISVEDIY